MILRRAFGFGHSQAVPVRRMKDEMHDGTPDLIGLLKHLMEGWYMRYKIRCNTNSWVHMCDPLPPTCW